MSFLNLVNIAFKIFSKIDSACSEILNECNLITNLIKNTIYYKEQN